MYLKDDQSRDIESPKLKWEVLLNSPNIAKHLKQDYLDALGRCVLEGYRMDRSTRTQWEQRTAEANKLAQQVVEEKSFPWAGCSNIKFPLVTIAALQFLSRVAILTKGRKIVKCDIVGEDPDGKKAARAARISSHLSYQLVEQSETWQDDDEKAKMSASIVGCAFKKTYFDAVGGCNISEYVPASQLVVDYYTKDIDKCYRVTHEILMTHNALRERSRRGVFLEADYTRSSSTMQDNLLSQTADQSQGITAPQEGSIDICLVLEQLCWIDLDGDGYEEPYVVSVKEDSGQVLRVVARFLDDGDVHRSNDGEIRKLEADMLKAGEDAAILARYKKEIDRLRNDKGNIILRIDPTKYYTKIPFIPNPDGGFYDLGLGSLLAPLNASVNTIVNQLVDSGTMQNTAGGFLGRGVKMKGGSTSFAPFEWKPVDSTGDDLRKNIMPMPVNAPSDVLFRLLELLINYGERISGATDIMSGVSPGQNTPAETSRNTIEQGMKIFSGIYARMYRAFRRELQKMTDLNRLYLEDQVDYTDLTTGQGAMIARDDYTKGKFTVKPAADPTAVSETQQQQRAMAVKQAAATTPGYDKYQVEKDFLEAFGVQDVERLYPNPKGPNAIAPPPNPKMELELKKLQQKEQEHQAKMQTMVVELQQQADLNAAKILELEARATKEVAEAQGVETGHIIAAIEAQIGAARSHQEGLLKALDLVQRDMKQSQKGESKDGQAGSGGADGSRGAGMAGVSGDKGVSGGPQSEGA